MAIVPNDDALAIGERHGVRDPSARERTTLLMVGRIVVQRARPQCGAHRLEVRAPSDECRAPHVRAIVSFGRLRGAGVAGVPYLACHRPIATQSTTQKTGIGWLLPLSSIGGQVVRRGGDTSAFLISSVMRICPASAVSPLSVEAE